MVVVDVKEGDHDIEYRKGKQHLKALNVVQRTAQSSSV